MKRAFVYFVLAHTLGVSGAVYLAAKATLEAPSIAGGRVLASSDVPLGDGSLGSHCHCWYGRHQRQNLTRWIESNVR